MPAARSARFETNIALIAGVPEDHRNDPHDHRIERKQSDFAEPRCAAAVTVRSDLDVLCSDALREDPAEPAARPTLARHDDHGRETHQHADREPRCGKRDQHGLPAPHPDDERVFRRCKLRGNPPFHECDGSHRTRGPAEPYLSRASFHR
jgi:hypothetical protein